MSSFQKFEFMSFIHFVLKLIRIFDIRIILCILYLADEDGRVLPARAPHHQPRRQAARALLVLNLRILVSLVAVSQPIPGMIAPHSVSGQFFW